MEYLQEKREKALFLAKILLTFPRCHKSNEGISYENYLLKLLILTIRIYKASNSVAEFAAITE